MDRVNQDHGENQKIVEKIRLFLLFSCYRAILTIIGYGWSTVVHINKNYYSYMMNNVIKIQCEFN